MKRTISKPMCLFIIFISLLILSHRSNNVNAKAGYPYANYNAENCDLINNPGDCTNIDAWGFVKRNCTSYAAWAANTDGHFFTAKMGTPNLVFTTPGEWDTQTQGYFSVSNTPQAGDLMTWEPRNGGSDPNAGHAAYVESVNGNGTVNLSEYNFDRSDIGCYPYGYCQRNGITADHYIHVGGSNPCGDGVNLVLENRTISNGERLDCAVQNSIRILPNFTAANGSYVRLRIGQ